MYACMYEYMYVSKYVYTVLSLSFKSPVVYELQQ